MNSLSIFIKIVNKIPANNKNDIEMMKGRNATFIGFMMLTIPKIKQVFEKMVPVWSPIDISFLFAKTALIPKTNSGKVVAIEIKNNPISI